MDTGNKVLLGIAVILEVLSIALFLVGSQTAVAASLLVVGLAVLIIAVNAERTRPRR
jgi:uncharacterized membrane protein YphA (DoxX/SURF4 family)